LLGEVPHGFGLRETGSRLEDVLDERPRRVLLAEIDDAALRPRGVAVVGLARLRQEQHLHAAPRESPGGRQSGDAGAEDEDRNVAALGEGVHRTTSSAMSTARTECVIAPTDTKSTPARAAARAFAIVMPPEASVV